jgi:hypothetical protein
MRCGDARRRGGVGGAQRSGALQEPVQLNVSVSERTVTPPRRCRACVGSRVMCSSRREVPRLPSGPRFDCGPTLTQSSAASHTALCSFANLSVSLF